MEIRYFHRPRLSEPSMVAVWPGMGYLAKTSGDYLRRRLEAKLFAEIRHYQNSIVYRDSLAELSYLRHRFYAVEGGDLVICVGDAQPSNPDEAYRLARQIVGMAERLGVKRIYTMAAYPADYGDEPQVYGVYTDEHLREVLSQHGVRPLEDEGSITGLNGILIGVAKSRGIEGICLMAEIRYTNFPQHLSSKAVLEKLAAIIGIDVDTSHLVLRARRVENSIRHRLSQSQETYELKGDGKRFGYIS